MSAALLSILVTTYNRPDALGAVLDALTRQVDAGRFEVLVADDGSGPETRAVIERLRPQFPAPLLHVWQEDNGFRAAAARNAAVARSQGDYLIFLDGDCVPLPDFCAQHRSLMEPGWCVAGNRILLAEAFTQSLLATDKPADVVGWSGSQWRAAAARGDANKATALRRWSLGPLRKLGARRWQRVRTCNVAVWRQDFLAVDGFDESFTGWGYEDSDFAVRLMRHGVRIKDGRFAVPVLHLWHRENDRRNEPENRARLNETLTSTHIRARAGLSAHPAT